MKIRMIPENKVYAGTPVDIVKKLAQDAIFLKPKTSDDYMRSVARRTPGLRVEGKNEEERCEAFLRGLLEHGAAKVIIEKSSIDQYEIRVVRKVLGLSQERLAHQLHVSFASVNRWEKGLHIPSSEAVIENLRRAAENLVAA